MAKESKSDKKLRATLKDFNGFMCKNQWDGRIPLIDQCIDEYFEHLKTKL